MVRRVQPPRRVDRLHRIDLTVEPRLDELGSFRVELRRALADLDVGGATRTDCVAAVNEVVTAIIESRSGPSDAPIEVSVRRRAGEVEVLTVSRHVDGTPVVAESIRERMLDRLTNYSQHRVGIDEDEVLCCFDLA